MYSHALVKEFHVRQAECESANYWGMHCPPLKLLGAHAPSLKWSTSMEFIINNAMLAHVT